jgi:hypothetical protein
MPNAGQPSPLCAVAASVGPPAVGLSRELSPPRDFMSTSDGVQMSSTSASGSDQETTVGVRLTTRSRFAGLGLLVENGTGQPTDVEAPPAAAPAD